MSDTYIYHQEVTAIQYKLDNWREVKKIIGLPLHRRRGHAELEGPGTITPVNEDDWIVRRGYGDYLVVTDKAFKRDYKKK